MLLLITYLKPVELYSLYDVGGIKVIVFLSLLRQFFFHNFGLTVLIIHYQVYFSF